MKSILSGITRERALLMLGVMNLAASTGLAEPGLLLIAHGSPSPQWNQPVLDFGKEVGAEAVAHGPFKAARTAMLEFSEPSVPTAVAQLESAGCDGIVAVPLFIAPSGHSLFDVPTVLGTFYSPAAAAAIAEEGGTVARPKVPVRLTETFSGELLEQFALAEVRKLSREPADEAVVLLAHGDENHQRLVDRLMRRVATYCCGRAGIDYGDWAYVGVGQEYMGAGTGAIERALERKKRVLVVGIYVSLSAQRLHQRAVGRLRGQRAGSELFAGQDVVFSSRSVIGYAQTRRWVFDVARCAAK